MTYWEECIFVLQLLLQEKAPARIHLSAPFEEQHLSKWNWQDPAKWDHRTFRRRLRLERDAWQDAWAQWIWFAFNIPIEKVGFGYGPVTWARQARNRGQRRGIHICLLAFDHRGLPFGPLTAWAINRNSRLCTASLNAGLEKADVIWVYMQDPITADQRRKLEREISLRARPNAVIINGPKFYNAFHMPDTFARLQAAGVSVPRSSFDESDVGRTPVVYKMEGKQGGDKILSLYTGPRPGMLPFEFIDTVQADGTYCRYRAHYLLGSVRPSEVIIADHWNACLKHSVDLDYTFVLTDSEIRQIILIARTLNLQYFAVDFLRRPSNGQAIFTDVNVYPTIQSPKARVRARGDFGLWHTFDARVRMGLAEPNQLDVWELFDNAMARFTCKSVTSENDPVA